MKTDAHPALPGRPQAAEGRMFVTYAQSGSGQNVRSCPTAVETCSCRFILLSFHETRARETASLSLSLSSHRLAKQNAARSDGCFPSSPRLAALLTRLRWWLLVMDPVLAWLCFGVDHNFANFFSKVAMLSIFPFAGHFFSAESQTGDE